MEDIRKYIKDRVLVFDGAMGTYYSELFDAPTTPCEMANLTSPKDIGDIHRNYLAAGAKAIKSNTFNAHTNVYGDRTEDIIRAGYEIACDVAGNDAYVFADIGAAEGLGDEAIADEYKFAVSVFLDMGAKNFFFETNGSMRGLKEAAAFIRARCPDAFTIVSFAVQPNGFTSEGELYSDLLREAADDDNIDVVGLNCVLSAKHMDELVSRLEPLKKPLAALPNAGYPTICGRRAHFDGDPNYFASNIMSLREHGAAILGGCCGTTPRHIEAAAKALAGLAPLPATAVVRYPAKEKAKPETEHADAFWEKLCDPKQKPIAVELDSPLDADLDKFMNGAKQLRDAKVDIITIADCPIARARMDSSLLACKIHRELGVEALPHMTCRDRNQNATQALLLGLSADGIRNVLIVTGDPVPTASRDEVKSVYNFNSRKLIKYVESLNRTVLHSPFHIYGALNVNAQNFDIQLSLAKQKEENGAVGFLTQPVLTQQALENLQKAHETLSGKILGGIIPVVSQKNALFMNSEIAGITVDERIIKAYEGADRERGEELAVEISSRVAQGIAPYVDGFYLMTPFGRTGLMARIIDSIRSDGLA